MRVALVVPGGVDRTGEYRIIPALVALLRRLSRAHEVSVIALAQERTASTWELGGARIHNIGPPRTSIRAVQTICAQHRSLPFDLVHSIWSGYSGLVAVTASRLLRIPSLVHVAGGELVALTDIEYGGALTWRGRLRERLTLRLADAVSAASTPMVAAVKACASVNAQLVPLGVDLAVWSPQPPARRDPTQTARLIHVASLNRVKDQPMLLRALQELAHTGIDFQMDVVGEDTLDGEIQTLVRELGLAARVHFHGFLPQRLLRPLMQRAHLLVVSSRHEAGPLVTLEAAAIGIPTVGTAVGHIKGWAPEAAMAVPVGDSTALAGAIGRVLIDEELRLRIAREAFARAVLQDADYTAKSFEAIYAALVTSRAGLR